MTRDFSGLILSLAFAAVLLLCGCTAPTVKQVDRSDRPWLTKPAEIEPVRVAYMLAAPPKTFPIQCDVDATAIIGLQWGLERSVDLKVWTLVALAPGSVTGGTVTFTATNDAPHADYRVRTVWPE